MRYYVRGVEITNCVIHVERNLMAILVENSVMRLEEGVVSFIGRLRLAYPGDTRNPNVVSEIW